MISIPTTSPVTDPWAAVNGLGVHCGAGLASGERRRPARQGGQLAWGAILFGAFRCAFPGCSNGNGSPGCYTLSTTSIRWLRYLERQPGDRVDLADPALPRWLDEQLQPLALLAAHVASQTASAGADSEGIAPTNVRGVTAMQKRYQNWGRWRTTGELYSAPVLIQGAYHYARATIYRRKHCPTCEHV